MLIQEPDGHVLQVPRCVGWFQEGSGSGVGGYRARLLSMAAQEKGKLEGQ